MSYRKGINYLLLMVMLISMIVSVKRYLDWYNSCLQVKEDRAQYKIIMSEMPDVERETDTFTEENWQDFYEINEDFIGWIEFDSGLISQPIVQGPDDSYYLRRNLNREYAETGIVFLEAENQLSDQNIILYGHNVYADETAMFSPLHNLVNQELYEANKDMNLYLENEIRSYRIFCIYYFDTDDYKVFDYQQRNWTTEEEFNDWIRYAQDKNLINSDVQVSSADHLLTMQSCKPYDPDQRVLVLCRELGRRPYREGSSNEKAEQY